MTWTCTATVGATAALVAALVAPCREARAKERQPTSAPASAPAQRCKQRCESRRKSIQRKLERCLRAAESVLRDQAAKQRIACRRRFVAPRCEGRRDCPPPKKARVRPPGIALEPPVFSGKRRGPRLRHPVFRAGARIHLRVKATVTSRRDQSRMWLELGLRLQRLRPGKPPQTIAHWPRYLVRKKFLERLDRGVPLGFTLHGGALLPRSTDPGPYQAVVTVRERTLDASRTVTAGFRVTRR